MGKDHKKSRREEKDHGSRERDRDRDREHSKTSDVSKEREKEVYKSYDKDRRVSSRDVREDIEELEKDKHRDKANEKDYDQRDRHRDKGHEREKDQKDRAKDKDRERERDIEKEHHDRGRERKEKEKDRDRDREKEGERTKDREREKHRDREREKEKEKDRERDKLEREKGKGKDRERDRKTDGDTKERSKDREKDKISGKSHDRDKDEKGVNLDGPDSNSTEHKQKNDAAPNGRQQSTSEIEKRILQMKEGRLKKKSEGVPEILAWVSKSRKLEERTEKEKALHLSKVFEEQDNNVLEEQDEEPAQHTFKDLAGVKVLHGLDKVVEGGAVVLTLKDQNILADGDINDEVDMLENVEIGEQKQRDQAYKAAKKKPGIYEDKFNDEIGAEKKILPQYDDPVEDEGVTLDESGRFSGKAEKKLEELRKRILGVSTSSGFEDLNAPGKVSSDYYTQEEMLQFKKPKKKKALRKREKLDLDALEAEAINAGLGVGDLGSRKDGKRQAAREEKERSEAQSRSSAYQSAYAKAEEASKALRQERTSTSAKEDEVFGDEEEDLYKSLKEARKLALRRQGEDVPSGPEAVASLALTAKNESADTQNSASGETQESKVVFTEMEEFVWGLQLDEESHKPDGDDIYMDEDEVEKIADQEMTDEASGGWTEVNDTSKDELPINEEKEEIAPVATTQEVAVGKGLSGALQLLKERGTLKDTIEWGGRNMDKKKSKLVGIYENDGTKEINIERRDEFGRIMTPKEAFRMISHKFHGKEPGKMKKEKRMKQFYEDLKQKQMKSSDTPSQSMERMREAQARMKTPYLVLSGHVKPGQNSDPRSGFATVEGLPGGLTPMLGDRKVEHFLGIKRKSEPGSMGPPPPPKIPRS